MNSRAASLSHRAVSAARAWLVAATLLTVAIPSGAQPEPPSSQPSGERYEQAKKHFERGLAIARSSNWAAALTEFMQSLQLFGTRAAARNAAIALNKLGRHAEAYAMYERLLSEFGATMGSEESARVHSEKAELRQLFGELALNVRQAGASVVLDGVERGRSPLPGVLRLDPGRYTLEVSLLGHERHMAMVGIRAGERTEVQIVLLPTPAAGTLEVVEGRGRSFDVVVDAVVMGRTPWRGPLAPGQHIVVLRGANKTGTAPQAVLVKPQEAVRLVLDAVALDAELEVIPDPAESSVFIDGVFVGTGTWRGALPSGPHRVQIVLDDYSPFYTKLYLAAGVRRVLSNQLSLRPERPNLMASLLSRSYVELGAGALLAHSFAGDADRDCGCSDRSRPAGGWFGGRAGYELTHGLSAELALAYLTLRERMQRQAVSASPDPFAKLSSTDFADSIRLTGPQLLASAALRRGERFPITARIGVGVALLRSGGDSSGTFSGTLTNPDDQSQARHYSAYVTVEEDDQRLWTGVFSTELRLGYRITRHLSADLGAQVLLFVPQKRARSLGGAPRFSRLPTEGVESWGPQQPVRPGRVELPNELLASAFVAVSPSLGLRYEF